MHYPEGLPIHTIWDEIAYFLELAKDLLSLALTCHTFKELIIPDHLEYRYIHCDIRRGDVWRFLASRPRLGKGIRSVKLLHHIDDHGRICLPRALTNILDQTLGLHTSSDQHTDKSIALFRNALSHMTSLKEFSWKHRFEDEPSAEEVVDTSRVLTNTTHCLEALCPDFDLTLLLGNPQLLEKLSIWTLTGLKKVKILNPGTAAIHMTLDLCPDIEDLHLAGQCGTTSIYDVIQRANWKKLRRLHLYLRNTTPDTSPDLDMDGAAIITSFFDRHDNLESIHFEVFRGSFPSQPASYLPELRSIGSQIHSDGAPLPAYLSSGVMSRLVHWHCPIENLDIDTLPQMEGLESACLPIYDCFLPAFIPFLLKAPNLQRIFVGEREDILEHNEHEKLMDVYQKYATRLTHIICNYSLCRVPQSVTMDIYQKIDSSFFKRLATLRSLTYFQIIANNGGMILMKLEREDEGLYSGYRPVDLKEAGGDPHGWGNFFWDV